MADDQTIKVEAICKRKKQKDILQNISFEAKPGRVTAFLGHNGAGKSSTLRILLGLDYQTSGTATFSGKKYRQLQSPLKTVGAVFDGIAGPPSRKVVTHLEIVALSNDIPKKQVALVLKLVGLSGKSRAKLGTLSLGEGQRLGLATALLGDPQYLVLDEPTNGLDPEGIRWFRKLMRQYAKEGKTILLSSHLLSEIEAVADDIVLIDQGEMLVKRELSEIKKEGSLEDFLFAIGKEKQTNEESN